MLEGALNGFVIGTVIAGWIVSFLFLHIFAVTILPIVGIVVWFSFKGRRVVKERLERMRVEQFTRPLEQK